MSSPRTRPLPQHRQAPSRVMTGGASPGTRHAGLLLAAAGASREGLAACGGPREPRTHGRSGSSGRPQGGVARGAACSAGRATAVKCCAVPMPTPTLVRLLNRSSATAAGSVGARRPIAAAVLGAGVHAGVVVEVAEVPGLARVDWEATAGAADPAGLDVASDALSLAPVGPAVSAGVDRFRHARSFSASGRNAR